jgi:hypothetical protein
LSMFICFLTRLFPVLMKASLGDLSAIIKGRPLSKAKHADSETFLRCVASLQTEFQQIVSTRSRSKRTADEMERSEESKMPAAQKTTYE